MDARGKHTRILKIPGFSARLSKSGYTISKITEAQNNGRAAITSGPEVEEYCGREEYSSLITEAARILREGGLVAFPTETVYGLGADALNPAAVAGIFAAKGRPADNPLIVHVASPEEVKSVADDLPLLAEQLVTTFWPGPLTLVVPRNEKVPLITTAGLDTVAVRMPDHPVALSLIAAAGVPVAAPSANTSGRPSPTEASHVAEDLWGKVDIILDGGPTGLGVESTVIDCTGDVPVLLRPGGVSLEELRQVVGDVKIDPHITRLTAADGLVRSPGMKYTHYAPRARAILVQGQPPTLFAKMAEMAAQLRAAGEEVGVMISSQAKDYWEHQGIDTCAWQVLCMGSRDNLAEVAASIYACLRRFDRTSVTTILIEGLPEEGLGLAIMNRLRKAAGHRILQV